MTVGLALAATVLAAGPAPGGTITTPSAKPDTVPLNSQGSGPAPFPIAATGYPNPSIIYAMICDGTSPSSPGWDPNINCDNGTSPAGRPTAGGSASWDPANQNQRIGVFDGAAPSADFNCLYPGEPKPANGFPSFTNCQLRVATNDSFVTPDQAFVTLVLPRPTCGAHCPAAAGAGAAGQSAGGSGSGQGASGASGSGAGQSASGSSHSGHGSSWLAMTGANIIRLIMIALVLIAVGLLIAGWTRRRRSAEIA